MKLKWKTAKYITFHGRKIPLGEDVPPNPIYSFSPEIQQLMPYAKIADLLFISLLSSGFITRMVGEWIREYAKPDERFLDIGCGDLALRKWTPNFLTYNAFDIKFSEYTLDLALRFPNVNVAIASATKIPLDSDEVSMLTATEVLEHIPNYESALSEIHRVATANALFIVSIPNNYCRKYHTPQHKDHYNRWTFNGFAQMMETHGFKLIKSCKKGWWIPFPRYMTYRGTSYQLPYSSNNEYYSTNFFFAFRVIK